MTEFPRQQLGDGNSVCFGQGIREVEALLGVAAIDNPLKVARKGIDQKITTPVISLDFDSGRLRSMEFRESFGYAFPPQPFADEWANFGCRDNISIQRSMPRERFVDYIRAWECEAKLLGAKLTNSPDLAQGEFRYSFQKDKFFDMFHLSIGPSRRAGGGGIWASGWTAFFSMPNHPGWNEAKGSELRTLDAFCDLFNTVARRAR